MIFLFFIGFFNEKLRDYLPIYGHVINICIYNYSIFRYQFGYIHMKIDQENGKFTLGSCKTKSFLTLLDVINHYQKFPMDIEGVGKIQLTLPKFKTEN